MKGLLTKDFLTVKKKYGITRLIMDLAIIAALMIILEGAGSIYISFLLVPLEVASMLITLANSDEQWKWGKYAVALPISKRQIVSSRYAFGGIAAIIGLCVALVVNTISYFCFPAYQFILSFPFNRFFLHGSVVPCFYLTVQLLAWCKRRIRSYVHFNHSAGGIRHLVKDDKQCDHGIRCR